MGHSPHGECGLKRVKSSQINHLAASLSSRGVWIETQIKLRINLLRSHSYIAQERIRIYQRRGLARNYSWGLYRGGKDIRRLFICGARKNTFQGVRV